MDTVSEVMLNGDDASAESSKDREEDHIDKVRQCPSDVFMNSEEDFQSRSDSQIQPKKINQQEGSELLQQMIISVTEEKSSEEASTCDVPTYQKTIQSSSGNDDLITNLQSPPETSLLSTDPQRPETRSANTTVAHLECMTQQELQRTTYEQQLEQLRKALQQKDDMIVLTQRENCILEKEKQSLRKEKDLANREKESIVIKFAVKEKLLLDAKKEQDAIQKQLTEAKKEVRNVSTRLQSLIEEKSRVTYLMDEKCNEVRKYQREYEKLKTDYGHLESRLKYHINKLNIETDAKQALEKKLEEEKSSPNKLDEKTTEKIKMEYEANTILLKHEITQKEQTVETLTKEQLKLTEGLKQLQEQYNKELHEKNQLVADMAVLRREHDFVQNAYSEEMLNSAKLRGELDELLLLRTQNNHNEEKVIALTAITKDLEEKLQDSTQDLQLLRARECELLSINKEMSESIVILQNEICLLKAKAVGIESENEMLKKEQLEYNGKYAALKDQLEKELSQRTEERQLLAKHLSEKTKLNENTKMKLDNVLGELDATKRKHSQVVKELQREILKYKKCWEQNANIQNQSQEANSSNTAAASSAKAFAESVRRTYCAQCQKPTNGTTQAQSEDSNASQNGAVTNKRQLSRNGSQSSEKDSQAFNDCYEVKTLPNTAAAPNSLTTDLQGPTKRHLVERILRLQQASARQAEKIDFLENHTLSLVAELQKKSRVVQYYMLRDQDGALTSRKSDQNKNELAKYGGVMAAIYGGMKNSTNQSSMTLELSLEINKKLQAVLEDTLLKNITLKENLDVLGLEVDKLTRKMAHLQCED